MLSSCVCFQGKKNIMRKTRYKVEKMLKSFSNISLEM